MCSDHVDTKPYLLDVYGAPGAVKGLVVEGALACAHCKPRPAPVDLPDLG